jgi:hypothetical protein
MANLSKHKSDILKQKLAKADVGIGHMWITFQKHGLSHHGPAPSVLQGKFLQFHTTLQRYNANVIYLESLECHRITVQLD